MSQIEFWVKALIVMFFAFINHCVRHSNDPETVNWIRNRGAENWGATKTRLQEIEEKDKTGNRTTENIAKTVKVR